MTIKTFSDAVPVLAMHGQEPQSIGNKLWQVGAMQYDKGGVIALARELAAQDAAAGAPPIVRGEALSLSPDAAAARLRLRSFTVREHGLKWLVLQPPNNRRLTLDADDLSLAARLAQAAAEPLTIDSLADQLYARTGEPRPDQVALADDQAGALLSIELQDRARRYVAARRRSGDALLEAVAELAAARAEAQHGEWGIFLEAIGLDDGAARAQIRIHEACTADPRYAEKVRIGWLSESTARELLAAPPDVQAEVLARDEPPTRAEIRDAKRAPAPALDVAKPNVPAPDPDITDILKRIDAHGYAHVGTRQKGMTTYHTFRDPDNEESGVIELAEGELPFWLAELDEKAAHAQERRAAFVDARARFARLGWELTHDTDGYHLFQPAGTHYATTPDLAPQLRTLERFESSARASRPPAAPIPACATCGQPSTTRRNIGGITEPRCDECAAWQASRASVDQRDQFGAAICDRAEALGALIDYLKRRDDGRLPVLAPPGWGSPGQWTPCDARELAQLCDAWERRPALEGSGRAEAPPDGIRARAARLLADLAPLMRMILPDDPAALAVAIDDLHSCPEGEEAEYWLRVGAAIVEIELESEAAE